MRRRDGPINHGGMTSLHTPRDADLAAVQNPVLPTGADERFVGAGVMGLPFVSGRYLALRHFPATSFGPRFRALWHRDPAGAWTFYSTARSAWSMRVQVDGLLDWQVDMRSTLATRLMSTVGALLSDWAWTNRAVLATMGLAAGP